MTTSDGVEYFFTIKGVILDVQILNEFMALLKEQLLRIGINLDVVSLSILDYINEMETLHNFDLSLGWSSYDLYSLESSSPIGYNISLDYNSTLGTGKNNWYIETFNEMVPPESYERLVHYHAWQDYLMAEIVPCNPLFLYKYGSVYWNNLQGYNSTNGLMQSIGNMSFDSLHIEQKNSSELIIVNPYHWDLNPIIEDSRYNIPYIEEATMDPLVWIDGDQSYWPHLATDWTHINETHVRFTIREDVKWNIDPDGLFPDEMLDTEDIYFSYFCYSNISSNSQNFNNVKDCEIINETTIDFFFDSDLQTEQQDSWTGYLDLFNTMLILPEHYLNQSQLIDGTTPDDTHPSWSTFSIHCFGTGPYEIRDAVLNNHRNLTIVDDNWRLNPDLLLDSTLNWQERFGDTWAIKKICVKDDDLVTENVARLLAGTIDIMEGFDKESYSQFLTNESFDVQYTYDFDVQYLGFNLREDREFMGSKNPCPNDENTTEGLALRKAISYAMNPIALNHDVFNNEYYRTYNPISLFYGQWCSPTITKYIHNLGEAAYYMGLLGYDVDDLNATSEIIGMPLFVTFIGIQFLFVVFLNTKRKKKR